MDSNRFLVAYDIADPKRLRRVARQLEKAAIRVQKSVFIYQGSRQRLGDLLDRLLTLIDPRADIVQAWKLAPRQSAEGMQRGSAPVLYPDVAVLEGGSVRIAGENSRENRDE